MLCISNIFEGLDDIILILGFNLQYYMFIFFFPFSDILSVQHLWSWTQEENFWILHGKGNLTDWLSTMYSQDMHCCFSWFYPCEEAVKSECNNISYKESHRLETHLLLNLRAVLSSTLLESFLKPEWFERWSLDSSFSSQGWLGFLSQRSSMGVVFEFHGRGKY